MIGSVSHQETMLFGRLQWREEWRWQRVGGTGQGDLVSMVRSLPFILEAVGSQWMALGRAVIFKFHFRKAPPATGSASC